MIPCDSILARLEDEFASYQANGLLDTGKLLTQIVWFSQHMGIAVFGQEETVLHLKSNKAQLPCDFYLLDSAWLCDARPQNTILNFQSKIQVYTEKVCEDVINHGNCYLPNTNNLYPVSVSACNMDTPLTKSTITEYVASPDSQLVTWNNPILLKINNKKSVAPNCSKDCQCLFSKCPDEISIKKQGDSFYLYSTLENPIIYVKYYSYPIDKETSLPLVPDDPILQEALYYHLAFYFLSSIWLNGDDVNLESKIKFLSEMKKEKMGDALYLSKLPKFSTMINTARRIRSKWASYEIMGSRHW